MEGHRPLRCVAVVLLAILAGHGSAHGEGSRIVTEHFVVAFKDVSDETASAVARDAEQAVRDVTAILGQKTALPTINIRIGEEYRVPRSLAGERLMEIPADRLGPQGALSGPEDIRGRGPTIWHGVANVIAPSRHALPDWGRFLQEGFGGYMQERFGGKKPTPWPRKVYPTMGEDLHAATARLARDMGLLSLADARIHVNDHKLTRTRQLAWLQAASFVAYLIEQRSLKRFRKWYDGSPFETAFGVGLGTVESEWSRFVLGLKT